MSSEPKTVPEWARWAGEGRARAFTLGVEEEVMLLDAPGWNLAQAIDELLPRIPHTLVRQYHRETHAAAVELSSSVHTTVGSATAEMRQLRDTLRTTAEACDLHVASAGTHPFTVWREISVSRGARQEEVYGSMRELARREPTFALHVHVGIIDPEDAVTVFNQMRVHLPVLLALSSNSPFWQGRDTGLASARTPLFQAFPRVGIPRPFDDYTQWSTTVDSLVRLGAFPDHTYLWWDIRMQPRFGTVEIRIMDAQMSLEATAALVAFVQCLARLEATEVWGVREMVHAPEVLDENRFIAARDGVNADLIGLKHDRRVPLRDLVEEMLDACRPHAQDLGCVDELDGVTRLLDEPGAERQRVLAQRAGRLPGLVEEMASEF